mmetsp:Transcript_15584/g.24183  ORF Transcript_15584/g.24183 Transcript_15584/m.24183 type:complete len:434 (-) Transcript_15584:71-1372(-)
MVKSNASDLSPDGRASKRQKLLSTSVFTRVTNLVKSRVPLTSTSTGSTNSTTALVDDTKAPDYTAASLAPEIWAHVCDFLPYETLLQTAAVSRGMLVEVMPRVTMLHIDKSWQLHAGVTRRYGDVRDVYIYSLIEFENLRISYDCHLNEDTLTRALPFLCSFSSRLERVFLGGRRPNHGQVLNVGRVEGYKSNRFSDEDDIKMSNLIDSFSGAFRAGALPDNLWIAGLSCSRRRNTLEYTCKVCQNACKSFPLRSVVDFEDKLVIHRRYHSFGASNDVFDEVIFGLNVCLRRTQIEEIVMGRPGGKDLLQSKERFMTLLGRGIRHVVISEDDSVLYVVKYDSEELGQINRFIKRSSVDVTKLSKWEVTEAIRRSFAADDRDPIPQREQCYLAESSFNALKTLGLPIEETDFLNKDELYWGNENAYFHCDWRFY